MKKQQIKNIIKEELLNMLNEDVNYHFNLNGKKFTARFDVNSNPTKKGVKIQFTPAENLLQNPNEARQLATDLQVKLNERLSHIGMAVDFDPDVPYQNVIGFTLKLGTIANMIVGALQKQKEEPKDHEHSIPQKQEPLKENKNVKKKQSKIKPTTKIS